MKVVYKTTAVLIRLEVVLLARRVGKTRRKKRKKNLGQGNLFAIKMILIHKKHFETHLKPYYLNIHKFNE